MNEVISEAELKDLQEKIDGIEDAVGRIAGNIKMLAITLAILPDLVERVADKEKAADLSAQVRTIRRRMERTLSEIGPEVVSLWKSKDKMDQETAPRPPAPEPVAR